MDGLELPPLDGVEVGRERGLGELEAVDDGRLVVGEVPVDVGEGEEDVEAPGGEGGVGEIERGGRVDLGGTKGLGEVRPPSQEAGLHPSSRTQRQEMSAPSRSISSGTSFEGVLQTRERSH